MEDDFKPMPKVNPDPIFKFMMMYRACESKEKVDMTAGVYKDETLKDYLLPSVRESMKGMSVEDIQRSFKPFDAVGDGELASLIARLTLGDQHLGRAKNFFKVHCQSGGTGLFFGFELLKQFYPEVKAIALSEPTWPIHEEMVLAHGYEVKRYRYYDAEGRKFDQEGLKEDLSKLGPDTALLIQPCGHNPTGFDLSHEDWDVVIPLVRDRKFPLFFDMAYLGFATGDLVAETYPLRRLVEEGLPWMLSCSLSKNFGIYSGRVGAFFGSARSHSEANEINCHLARLARSVVGAPVRFAAEAIKSLLSSPDLHAKWTEDLASMIRRMKSVRSRLLCELQKTGSTRDWSFIAQQNGMFAYTGLTPEQVLRCINEFNVYFIPSGRISITGINEENVALVAKAFHEVTKND